MPSQYIASAEAPEQLPFLPSNKDNTHRQHIEAAYTSRLKKRDLAYTGLDPYRHMEIRVLHGPLKGLHARVLTSREVRNVEGKTDTVLDIVTTTKAENAYATIQCKDAKELKYLFDSTFLVRC